MNNEESNVNEWRKKGRSLKVMLEHSAYARVLV